MATPAQAERRDERDAGFTLIEVVVALALIAIVAAASLTFFIRGTRSVTTQQRQQDAVAVANEAMETAYSRVPTTSAAGVSGLVTGRTQADVTAAWNAAVTDGVVGLSDTFPSWDTSTAPAPAPGAGDDAVKLTRTVTESRIPFTVTTLVGHCYRLKTTTTAQCTQSGGSAAGVAGANYTKLMRAIVVVRWPNVSGTCSGSLCSYSIAALLDPSTDLQWNNTTLVLAADDGVNMDANTSVSIRVLDNDTLPQISAGSTNPVSIISSPVKKGTTIPMGTASVNPTTGVVTYTAPIDAHGEVTFGYRVDLGSKQAQAVVHAYVRPIAADLSANGSINNDVAIPVLTRTGETPVSLQVMANPTKGTVSAVGASFTYRANAGGGGADSFTYQYTDAEGMTSLPGIVTLTNYAGALINDVTVSLNGNSTDYYLNLQNLAGNSTTGYLARPTGSLTGGSIKIDGVAAPTATGTGASVTYTPPANTAGKFEFKFRIVDPAGVQTAAEKKVYLLVQPVATADTFNGTKAVTKGSQTNLAVGANDTYAGTTFTQVGTPTCGSLSIDQNTWRSAGTVKYTAPNSVTTCTFQYKLVPLDGTLTTTPTVTVSVTTK